MASNPIVPNDFKNVIPAANSNICAKLLASLITFPTLFYRWYSWAFKADGSPSDDFKAAIGVSGGTLSVPTSVSASDGTYTDKVRVTWDPVAGASSYEVYRGSTDDPSSATLIGTPTAQSFDDSANGFAVDTSYWYFVKAINVSGSSGFSEGNKGYADSTGGGGSGATGNIEGSGTQNWTVPAGASTLQFIGWGAGGGGGGDDSSPWSAPAAQYGGGAGGGGGEYMDVTAITVTPGDVYTLAAGAAGAGDSNGSPGGPTILAKAGVTLVQVNGGQGGTGGKQGSLGADGAGGTGGTAGVGTISTQTPGSVSATPPTLGYFYPAYGAPGTGGAGGLGSNPWTISGVVSNNNGGAGQFGHGTKGSAGRVGHWKIVWS